MFTNHIHHGDSWHHVNVTEKKAPTDESLRLLSEMEAAVEKRVIERGRVENTVLDIKWIVIQERDGYTKTCHCRFILNEKEFSFSFECYEYISGRKKQLIDHIFKNVQEQIARLITFNLLQKPGTDLLH